MLMLGTLSTQINIQAIQTIGEHAKQSSNTDIPHDGEDDWARKQKK